MIAPLTRGVRAIGGVLAQLGVRRNILGYLLISGCVAWAVWTVINRDAAILRVTERAELELDVYATSLENGLRRTALIPLLLSLDKKLASDLSFNDFTDTSAYLIELAKEVGALEAVLYDKDGRAVAATDRKVLGEQVRNAEFFVEGLRSKDTRFHALRPEGQTTRYIFSRRIRDGQQSLGVIAITASLAEFERRWAQFDLSVYVTDTEGEVILSSVQGLKGQNILTPNEELEQGARTPRERSRWARAFSPASQRVSVKVGFQGWVMYRELPAAQIVSAVFSEWITLMLALTGVATLALLILNQRVRNQLIGKVQESRQLRELNRQLESTIAEKELAQKSLATAEQTLEQSSKLAALGQMSAAVAHELNQPLAAMKTYIASARMLLDRTRVQDVRSAFVRLNTLTDRMSAITKQLKSYAAKGDDEITAFDVRLAMADAHALVAQDFRSAGISYREEFPNTPVSVLADKRRLERVFINLLSNARDAVKTADEPTVVARIDLQSDVVIRVIDNGPGIEDFENLFEPFYTTKRSGDGIGLGLAISSSIINELGGRLIAQNRPEGGAEFQVHLNRMSERAAPQVSNG